MDMPTPQQLERFLASLEKSGVVTRAAAEADIKQVRSLYEMRRKDEAFREAWDFSMEIGIKTCEDLARERAFLGRRKGVYHQGERVDTEMVYSDSLAIKFLEKDNPAFRGKDVNVSFENKVRNMSEQELNELIEKISKQVGILS